MQEELHALAMNLRWSWDARIRHVFETLSPELWLETRHNPIVLLNRLGPEGITAAADREDVVRALEVARAATREHLEHHPPFFDAGAPLLVGYFSLEFGLAEALPIYSGGLGILAGDHLKAASDLNLPLVGVGLLYRWGFGRQRITADGQQSEVYVENRAEDLPIRVVDSGGEPIRVDAPIGAETVKIAIWRAQVGRIPLFLLDTDLEENPPHLRTITDRLYVPEPDRRLRQEIVLGIGGMRALRAVGMEATVFHMNEGHSALVGIERIRELRGSRQLTFEEARLVARAGIVFTTHTPVAAGSDYFDPGLVFDLLGPYLQQTGLSFERFMDLGREKPGDPRDLLCSTYLALRLADASVGVSRLHGAVSRRLWRAAWPSTKEAQVPIGSVTNGVHLRTWVADEVAQLLSEFVGEDWWELGPEDSRWAGVDAIPAGRLWATHRALRHRLVDFAAGRGDGDTLDPEALTIAFSRRFAPYKRATLLLSDRERLSRLLGDAGRPVQFLFSGKAHPADMPGKALLGEIVATARAEARFAFLEDYDIDVARHLVQGADIWLNNPRRFLEASGTSGMKAAANGVLNLSVLDGWWDEGYSSEVGWAIPSGATIDRPATDDVAEAEALYRLLEREILPVYFERDQDGVPQRWVTMMKASIRRLAPEFSARRMVLDYFSDAYGPAARRVKQLRLLPDWGG
ncbi:MAG: glycosyltransferase family 1 protein [Candidatus Dormibacteraceae bacterium]